MNRPHSGLQYRLLRQYIPVSLSYRQPLYPKRVDLPHRAGLAAGDAQHLAPRVALVFYHKTPARVNYADVPFSLTICAGVGFK